MSDRAGIGFIEESIVAALEGATTVDRKFSNSELVTRVSKTANIAPKYVYEIVLDMADPSACNLPMLGFVGDLGDRKGGDLPSGPQYSWSHLTDLGELVSAAERGEVGPIPVGLINGDTYAGGARPSLSPTQVVRAIRDVLEKPHSRDKDLVAAVGLPAFPSGCEVSGDLSAFGTGGTTELTLTSRILTDTEARTVTIDRLPPDSSAYRVASAIDRRIRREGNQLPTELAGAALLPIYNVEVLSGRELVCTATADADLDDLCEKLLTVSGVRCRMRVSMGHPVPAVMREWVRRNRGEDILSSLGRLESVILAR